MFALGDRGEGGTLIRLAYARSGEKDGLVVETDSRFTMKFSSLVFKEWRKKSPVRGARVLSVRLLLLQKESLVTKNSRLSSALTLGLYSLLCTLSTMTIEIKLRKGEPMDRAIRRLKKRLDREGTIRDVREKRYFRKPSDKERGS